MGYLDTFSSLATVLSQMARDRAAGKVTEGNLANQQNAGATSRYQALVNASRLQNVEQPAANMKQAGQGGLMSSWQPMSVQSPTVPYGSVTNGPVRPTISGGPSVTPEMRSTGESVMRNALSRQLNGNTLNTSTFPSDSALGLNGMPQSGAADTALGVGSTVASLLGAFAKPAAAAGAGAVPSALAPLAASGTGTGFGAGGLATGLEGAGSVTPPTSSGGWLSWLKNAFGGGGGPSSSGGFQGGANTSGTPGAGMFPAEMSGIPGGATTLGTRTGGGLSAEDLALWEMMQGQRPRPNRNQ